MTSSREDMLQAVRNQLYVAVVCDVLDKLGYRHQGMHSRLRPLLPDPERCGFAGRARTLRWMDVDYIDERDPYGLEIEAMDSLRAGDVVVHSTDHARSNAPWGELMTTVAKRNGAAGCVCDSNVRDCLRIIELGFPVFCAGIRPVDSMGRSIVQAYDVPVRCGEVLVQPGDLVFADYDGIVVVPQAVEAQALEMAFEKASKENSMRDALGKGKTLREAYGIYGIL